MLGALGRDVWSILRGAGVNVLAPEGGFYLFPDFSPHARALAERGISNSVQLCERLLAETGVAILPGVSFGRSEAELTARLSYVDFDGGAALDALASDAPDREVDDAFLRTFCGRTIEAAEVIASWLESV